MTGGVAGRHLEQIDFNRNEGVLIVSSNLTGQFWDGALNYLPKLESNSTKSVYNMYAAKELFVGAADGQWIDPTHVIVGTDNGTVEALSLSEGFFIDPDVVSVHHSYVTSLSCTSDGSKSVSGSADSCIHVCDIHEAALIHKYRGHSDMINQVICHNEDVNLFASCGVDGRVALWDTRKQRPAVNIDGIKGIPTSLELFNNFLAIGCESGEVIINDRRSGQHPQKRLTNHKRAVRRLAASPLSSSLLATGGEDGGVTVISMDLLNTQTLYRSDKHQDFVTGLAWHPVTGQLVSCSWDSTIIEHSVPIKNGCGH